LTIVHLERDFGHFGGDEFGNPQDPGSDRHRPAPNHGCEVDFEMDWFARGPAIGLILIIVIISHKSFH
jgi:hypothetical protein